MREPKTNIPALLLNARPNGSRIAFLPADVDRRFSRDLLPDHGQLLANLLRWAVKDNVPLSVQGAGLIDCHLYQQPRRFILHLVNLTNAATWRQPVDELIPVGPLRVTLRLPPAVAPRRLQLLVGKRTIESDATDGQVHFEVPSILDHEVVVIG